MTDISNTDTRPMTGIKYPEDNDVPMGRGGFVNSHRGHRRYLKMVQDKQLEYVQCKKADKMAVAWSIVHGLRAQDPPARFLKKDAKGLWNDVGDKKFREKVSQALREHQPFIKAVIETNENDPLPQQHQSNEAPRSFLPTLKEQPSRSFEDTAPSVLESADRRRAFLTTRCEINLTHAETLPAEEDFGFNLSEFSVSHGPSFPEMNPIQERRASSGWGSLLDILDNRHQALDWELLNESNADLSVAGDNYCYIENPKIETEEPLFPAMGSEMRNQNVTLKRSSPTDFDESSDDSDCEYSPTVKRCTLGRDKSEVARLLKEAYCAIEPVEITISLGCNGVEEEQGMDSLMCALEKSFPFHYSGC